MFLEAEKQNLFEDQGAMGQSFATINAKLYVLSEEWHGMKERIMAMEHVAVVRRMRGDRRNAALLEGAVGDFFKRVWDNIKKFFKAIWEYVVKSYNWLKDKLKSFYAWIKANAKAIKDMLVGTDQKAEFSIPKDNPSKKAQEAIKVVSRVIGNVQAAVKGQGDKTYDPGPDLEAIDKFPRNLNAFVEKKTLPVNKGIKYVDQWRKHGEGIATQAASMVKVTKELVSAAEQMQAATAKMAEGNVGEVEAKKKAMTGASHFRMIGGKCLTLVTDLVSLGKGMVNLGATNIRAGASATNQAIDKVWKEESGDDPPSAAEVQKAAPAAGGGGA